MKTLYPYQEIFLTKVREAATQYQRIVGVLPTGGGKTICFVSITKQAIAKGRTVLIISESIKIFQQISRELATVEIKAGSRPELLRKNVVYLAMAQTLQRRPQTIANFAHFGKELTVIIDEAHIGTPTGILKQLMECYLIGVTATPDWRSAKHLPILYNAIVVGPHPDELVNQGYLSSYKHFQRKVIDPSLLEKEAGEYTEESQERAFDTPRVYDGLVGDLKRFPFKKALVFTASIRHCEKLFNELSVHFPCVRVHSKLSKAESDICLLQFTHGAINICISVGTLTKGFDHPPIDLVCLQRATTSLPLYLQMIGRGSRKSEGKNHFTVLDYGMNGDRHHAWDMQREWEKMWNGQDKPKRESPAPVKFCPACEFMMSVSQMICPECGFEFKKEEARHIETVLVELTASYRELIGKKISELNAGELAIYARSKNRIAYASRVAKAKEQENPGFLKEFEKAMGYKSGWHHIQKRTIPEERIEYMDIELR